MRGLLLPSKTHTPIYSSGTRDLSIEQMKLLPRVPRILCLLHRLRHVPGFSKDINMCLGCPLIPDWIGQTQSKLSICH